MSNMSNQKKRRVMWSGIALGVLVMILAFVLCRTMAALYITGIIGFCLCLVSLLWGGVTIRSPKTQTALSLLSSESDEEEETTVSRDYAVRVPLSSHS